MHGLESRFLVSVFGLLLCGSVSAQVTQRVSVAADGSQGDGDSGAEYSWGSFVSVSGDGRYVAFDSVATNLVPGDTNDCDDVFVRDRITGELTTAVVVTCDRSCEIA